MGIPRYGLAVVALSLALAMPDASAFGTVVTIRFEGTIDYVESGLSISGVISAGMSFEGRYSYDVEAPDLAPDDTAYGYYAFPTHQMLVNIGPLAFSTADLRIAITDYSSFYDYSVGNSSTSPFSANGINWSVARVALTDFDPTPSYSDELPEGAPILDNFLGRQFVLTRVAHIQPSVRGTITSIARFPEPGTLTLLTAGGIGIARRRRRDSRGA